MSEGLQRRIAERRASIEAINRQIEALETERVRFQIEMATYEDALATVQAEHPRARAATAKRTSTEELIKSTRRLKQEWADILRHFGARHPQPFSIDDIMVGIPGSSFQPSRGNVRSQMSQYFTRGLVERVGEGVFRLTERGFLEVGLQADELSQELTGPEQDALIEHYNHQMNACLGFRAPPNEGLSDAA